MRIGRSARGSTRALARWSWLPLLVVGSRLARADEPTLTAEAVQVHGSRVADPVGPRDPSVAGSVVTRERLSAPGLEAQDVLRTQPGVIVTETGGFGAPATAAIRGATAADTPVYLGGVRLNDDVAGTADLSLVPLWLLDRVEVYRGNAPVDADRLGPGGAIFFEPRRPTRSLGGAGFYGGSFGASKGWAYQAVKTDDVSALVGVSADHATNRYPFVNDHGTLLAPTGANAPTDDMRGNADESTLDGWGLARVSLGRGASVDLLVNGITREQGVPSLALLPTVRARQRATRALGSVGVRVPVGPDDDRERVVLQSRTSYVLGTTAYDDPLLELALYTQHLKVSGERVEEALSATIHVNDGFRLHPEVNLAHEGVTRDPDDIPLGRAHREFGRLALGAEKEVTPWLTARALASGECHHTGVSDGACNVLEPTGRVGLEAGTAHLKVLANAGRYVRVPVLGEVYGVSGTVHGNANLAPETGETLDVGLRAQTPRAGLFDGAFVDAFVFVRWADGLIAYERTGQGFVTPYNVGAARVSGLELLTGVGFARFLRLEVAATALDPRDTSKDRTTVNDILPFRSRLIAVPRLRADWKASSDDGRSGLSALGFEVRAVYQSSRYADPAGLALIEQQVTVDLEANAALFEGRLTARARLADLLDARRTDIVGYPLPGRSGYFGMEASW